MEVEVGGVYLFQRKQFTKIKMYDCNSEVNRAVYHKSMNGRMLVIAKDIHGKCGKNSVYVWNLNKVGLPEVTTIYIQWLEKITFVRKLRDLRDWPDEARHYFLVWKGCGISAAFNQNKIEEARRSIARADRMRKFGKKRKKQRKKKKNEFFDKIASKYYGIPLGGVPLNKNFKSASEKYIEIDSASAMNTAEGLSSNMDTCISTFTYKTEYVTPTPHLEIKHHGPTCKIWDEVVYDNLEDPPDIEIEFTGDDDETE